MADGKKILTLVRGMQQLNIEIATLIRTFDKIMDGHGYKNDNPSTVIRDRSDSLLSPEYWTPPYMYRLLNNEKDKDDVFNLNIILDDPENPEKISEPLLLCARFKYAKGKANKHAGSWDVWDIWCGRPVKQINHFYETKELDLNSEEFLDDSDWKGDVDHMKEVYFMAVPLASINTSKELEKVIKQFFKN